MSVQFDNCSLTTEISKAEKAIKECYEKIETLEIKLKGSDNSEIQSATSQELKEIKKLLNTHKQKLSALHSQNRKSFAAAVFIMLLTFALYMLYILIFGRDF